MADDATTTIDRPPVAETGGVDVSSALTAKPSELETPKSATPTVPPAKSRIEEIGEQVITENLKGAERAGRAAEEYAASVKREQEARQKQREATKPAREEALKTIQGEERFLQEHPREPPQALPPRPRLNYNLNELLAPGKAGSQFMQQIGVFASLAGRTTQERLILALTAYNGMVEGWAKGKQEQFNEAYNAWKDEITNIHDTEKRKRDYVNDVLSDTKTSLELKAKKIELLGMEDGDAMLAEQAFRKDLTAIDGFLDAREQRLDSAMKAADTVAKHVEKQQLDQLESSPGILDEARRYAHGFTATPGAGAGYRAGSVERRAIANVAARIMADEGITDAQREQSYERNVVAGRAGASAGARVAAQRTTNLEIIEQRLAYLIPDALAASDAVPRGRFRQVNEIVQAWQRGAGDPRLAAFAAANFNLADTWALSQKPTGVLDVTLRNQALDRLSTTDSKEVYATVVNQVVREIARNYQGAKAVERGEVPQLPAVPGAYVPPGQQPLQGQPSPYVAPGPPAPIGDYNDWVRQNQAR